jgi:hypothetical protein
MSPSSQATYMPFRFYGDTIGTFNNATNDPAPTARYDARSETPQEKRDRLSKAENKRLIEARKRGGKMKF